MTYQARIVELLAAAEPRNTVQIADALAIDRSSAGALLAMMAATGQVRAVKPPAVGFGKCWKLARVARVEAA